MRKSKKKTDREKNILSIGLFLFSLGFIYLCQHMSIIRLGYILTREKAMHKELSNTNRSLYIEKTSLRSPRHLKVASNNLGLGSAGVRVRKIYLGQPSNPLENKNKFTNRIARVMRFNSEAQARTFKSNK